MTSNPLTYLELEAFERKTAREQSVWEVELIMRLDDAVRGVNVKDAPKPSASPDQPAAVDAADVKGVRSLFLGLAARRAASQTAQEG